MNVEAIIYDDKDNQIIVSGYIIEGMRGMHDYYGLAETPDDPDEIEIHSAIDINDEEIELTKDQTQWAIEEMWDNAAASR